MWRLFQYRFLKHYVFGPRPRFDTDHGAFRLFQVFGGSNLVRYRSGECFFQRFESERVVVALLFLLWLILSFSIIRVLLLMVFALPVSVVLLLFLLLLIVHLYQGRQLGGVVLNVGLVGRLLFIRGLRLLVVLLFGREVFCCGIRVDRRRGRYFGFRS